MSVEFLLTAYCLWDRLLTNNWVSDLHFLQNSILCQMCRSDTVSCSIKSFVFKLVCLRDLFLSPAIRICSWPVTRTTSSQPNRYCMQSHILEYMDSLSRPWAPFKDRKSSRKASLSSINRILGLFMTEKDHLKSISSRRNSLISSLSCAAFSKASSLAALFISDSSSSMVFSSSSGAL